jgi:hypothetical protein
MCGKKRGPATKKPSGSSTSISDFMWLQMAEDVQYIVLYNQRYLTLIL